MVTITIRVTMEVVHMQKMTIMMDTGEVHTVVTTVTDNDISYQSANENVRVT